MRSNGHTVTDVLSCRVYGLGGAYSNNAVAALLSVDSVF